MQTVKDIGTDVVTLSQGKIPLNDIVLVEPGTSVITVTLYTPIEPLTCAPCSDHYSEYFWIMLIVFLCWLFPRRR